LYRLEKFKEVYLDFRDVTDIGQAFADEIFRVFKNDHPNILLIPVNLRPEVARMIQRVMSQEGQTELPI
jgi:anti-anti-sigma regulatory factor